MSTSNKKPGKITLGDDGELHQQLENPATSLDAIFCVYCTTANIPDSKFCRECGQSLLVQQSNRYDLHQYDLSKEKRAASAVSESRGTFEELSGYLSNVSARSIAAGVVGTILLFFVVLPKIFEVISGIAFDGAFAISMFMLLALVILLGMYKLKE